MLFQELAVGETNDDKLGIMHPKALMFCGLWYLFSSLTLFLNKYIVDIKKGDAGLLGKRISTGWNHPSKFLCSCCYFTTSLIRVLSTTWIFVWRH